MVGSPIVECEREFIHFSVPTKRPFRGRIYVKGEYANGDCVRIYDVLNENEGQSAEVHRNDLSSSNRKPAHDEAPSPDTRLFSQPTSSLTKHEQNGKGAGWRDFLRGSGDPTAKAQRHKGAKEECPLVCPPCDIQNNRHRRQTKSNGAEIDVRLGTCNVQRDRTVSTTNDNLSNPSNLFQLNPPGLRVSTVVVVSFHQNFVTKVDKAYRVDCLYEESNRQVTTKMDVSMPQTVELSSEMQSPRCEYRIKAKNGVDLKNVRVGDEVLHEWRCTPVQASQADANSMKNMFGMLVHSCYVDNGQGKKQLIVDSHGLDSHYFTVIFDSSFRCSQDEFILPTPNYAFDQLKASIIAPVVKFPDRDIVGFQCAISVFVRELGNTVAFN